MTPAPATILVVDDEPELLEIFATWLRRTGYRVHTAPNGAEALRILTTEKIDSLLSDIRMPIMDGPTLVRTMREMGLTIPTIIFVSGFGDIDVREMHALGVEATVEKPLRRQTVLTAIADSLADREKLWLDPLPQPCRRQVEIQLPQTARSGPHFDLGRGGCCFPSTQSVAHGETIELHLRFTDQDRSLNAQGEVRWFDPDSRFTGVAFRYLHPESRNWVIQAIREAKPRSFIPKGS